MMKIYFILASLLIGMIVHQIVWGFVVVRNRFIADIISIIIGALVPLLTILFLFKKKLLTNTIFLELLLLTLIGFIIQQSTYATAPYSVGFFNEYIGFTLFLPLFGLLFHSFNFQSKSTIVFMSIFLAIVVHVINFILYPIVGGHTEQMYGIILIFGLPIALGFGIIYAIYFIKFYFKEVVER